MFVEELALNTHTRKELFIRNNVFNLMKDAIVIDVGCGTGFFSSMILQHAKKLICVDISKNNIESAMLSLGAQNVEFLVSDCKKIDIPDGKVDIVFCTGTIEHTKNPVSTLDEFRRILRPGGKLILTVDVNPEITGGFRERLVKKAQVYSEYTTIHPEVHKKSIFSDKQRPIFFDRNKLIRYLARDFELIIEDYGGGVFSNIIDSFLIFFNALKRPKELRSPSNLASHYSRLENPLIRFYIKVFLPVIKVIAAIDNFKHDAFVDLLVFEKKACHRQV